MSSDNGVRSTPACVRRFPRGGTIINILSAIIFFGLLAAGVAWVMKATGDAGKQYGQAMIDTKHKSMVLACQMNFRSIGQCLQTYAVGGEGFPDTQQELIDYCGGSRVFHCPDPCGVEYVYVPGGGGDVPDTTVLVYEPKPVHDGKCNVLFANGQIALLTPEELKTVLDATLARRRR